MTGVGLVAGVGAGSGPGWLRGVWGRFGSVPLSGGLWRPWERIRGSLNPESRALAPSSTRPVEVFRGSTSEVGLWVPEGMDLQVGDELVGRSDVVCGPVQNGTVGAVPQIVVGQTQPSRRGVKRSCLVKFAEAVFDHVKVGIDANGEPGVAQLPPL